MFSKNKTARIGIVCFVVFCLCMLLAGSAVAKKPVKPEPPPPPQETEGGILSLDGINIVTVQPWEDGSLHVWSDNSVSPVWSNIVPDSSWTLLDVYHRAVAIGDLDGNGLKEILVHAACSYNGDSVTFINAYEGEDKQVDPLQIRDYIDGIQDPWWTTYYSPDDFVEQGTSIRDQIIAADLDKNGDDEIVLITSEYISIFDYDFLDGEFDPENRWQGPGTIRKIAEISLLNYFSGVFSGNPAAAVVGNVEWESNPDIIVTVNIIEEQYGMLFGYLLIWPDSWTDLSGDDVFTIKGAPTYGYNPEALQLSNEEDDAYTKIWTGYNNMTAEICRRGKKEFPCNRRYDSYLSFWEKNSNSSWTENTTDLTFPEASLNPMYIKIATGEVFAGEEYSGDEIVLKNGAQSGTEMRMEVYNAESLAAGSTQFLQSHYPGPVVLNKVAIHDGKIILGGAMQGKLPLFLQVFDPLSNIVEWEFLGGPGSEVADFAVIGSDTP